MASAYMTTWTVDQKAFDDLLLYIKQNVYAFKHGQNQDLEVQFVGFITNEPGMIVDLINCYSFDEREIDSWKTILTKFGASHVQVSIDAMQRVMTLHIYYEKQNKATEKTSFCSPYKLLTPVRYVPTFVWAFISLVLWNPQRYLML